MRRWLKKHLPNHKTIQREKSLRWIHQYLHHLDLWQWRRHTVAKGVAIGFFITFLPVPFQMLWAALLAILFRANLPIAVMMTWINNPFTFVPINFFIYKIGIWIIGNKHVVSPFPKIEWTQHFSESWRELLTWLTGLGKPYLVGLITFLIVSTIVSYCAVQGLWTLSTAIKDKCPRKKQ